MEVQFGPNSVDEPNLLYKLQRKIKVFNTQDALSNRGYNLVASSSKYGIVFVASPDGSLSVYQLPQLVNTEVEPQHVTVKLQEKPTHIAVSCDQELLAVTGGQLLNIYKITDFQNQNVSPSVSVKCDANPSTFVSAMQWNPCIPDSIVIVFYDGMLLACQASTSQTKKVPSKGRCLCWSPKGKQFVTGNSDGTLTQYKPDLTPAKLVPPPKLFEGSPVEALAVYWISTFQFAVVYKNTIDNSRPVVTIVNTPKAGQPSCLNYEDICYSMGANRPWFYYLQGIAPWNIILSSSSNSMEIGTLGSADGANWVQWSQTDEARPELPLTDKKQENYPVGICIDTSAIHQLPWGENEILPFMPTLLVVSQTGLLTLFNVINMNKQAGQVCSPPQLLPLPANALRTDIPGELPVQPQPVAPSPVAQPVAPVIPKPIPIPQQYQAPPQHQAQAPPSHVGKFGAPAYPAPGGFTQQTRAFGASIAPQMVEQKQPVDVKPTPPAQPTVAAQVPKQPAHAPHAAPSTTQSQEVYAAAKAEQDRLKALKAQQELKNMLVKEVNDFQMELYKFTMKTRETQAKIMQEIDAINLNFNMQGLDAEQLKKDCSLEELRGAVVQLKLELVRACAVVAEARTHAEANDIHQWSQADPLTTKRLATVKKLAYYVQNQVDQAYGALDHKWNENASRDSGTFKPGQRMIRPVLDDVYQPLVKQQEILCRQEAVLRTLKNTLKEVDSGPMFKSSSLLRSTPFRNKDPLSKLTKNILNMSIEPQSKSKELLSAQKLDALRDMLSNHNTVKVKPVSVDLRQQLSAMRLRYEKSVEEKAALAREKQEIDARTRVEAANKVAASAVLRQVPDIVKVEPKPEIVSPAPLSVPTYTPFGSNAVKPTVPGLTNVARTLFAEEPAKPAEVQAKPAATAPSVPSAKPPAFAPQPPAPAPADNHRSVLKDLLQKKQANAAAVPKSDANTFMGQKICSPTAFAFGTPNAETKDQPAQSKPPIRVLDTKNMFSNFQPQAFSTAPQPPAQKSSETGEPDPGNAIHSKKEDKPISSIFGTSILSKDHKPLTNLFGTKSANIAKETPVQKPQETAKVENKAPVKVILKAAEKSKENVPEKVAEAVTLEPQKPAVQKKEPEAKPLNMQSFNFGSGLSVQPVVSSDNVPTSQTVESQKSVEVNTEIKAEEPKVEEKADSTAPSTESSNASSLFAAANASSPTAAQPQPVFGSTPATTQSSTPPITPSSSTTSTDTTEKPSIFASATASSASSIFSTAVASQASKTTQSGSIFNTSTTSVFSSNSGSLFGTSTTPTTTSSVFGTPTSPSVFSGEAKPVFNTTQTTAQSVFASSPSVFAQASTAHSVLASSTTGSIFGTASTQASAFGTSTATTSVFGSPATQASVFGTPTTTAASLFGSPPTTQASVFGSPATTAQSVFGTATATTQAASVFGSANQSVFGSTAPSTQASIFGSPSTQVSVFGTATPSTQASVFGSPTSTTQSVFGSTPATTTQSGSLFGGAEANLFAAASISTTSAPSQSSGGSIFGSSSPGSVFGGGTTNVFGGKSTFNQSNPTAAAIFGGGGASAFGQQKQPQANNFWSGGTGNAGSPGFGSGFGQQAHATQASSIFGSATGGSFSTPSPAGQAFGSPQQAPAFGTGDNKPSVFGSPQQQTSPAFGGSPVFGSKPVFGQPSGFGSPTSGGFGSFGGFNKSPSSGFGGPAAFGSGASFGGAPAFGNTSPGKVFGGAPQGFGSPTQSNATFESLATQNTLTFGNLAQQSGQQPQQAAPSFNTSPAFTGWRG